MRTFDEIRKDGDLLYESIRGSHLYGLNTEKSDIDTFGLYSANKDELFGFVYCKNRYKNGFIDQTSHFF